jgi:hypothetical protein
MHAVLIAKALTLPAWLQLLHPVATVIAKSKLWCFRSIRRHSRRRGCIRWWATIRLWHHRVAPPRSQDRHRYRQTEAVPRRSATPCGIPRRPPD